MKTAPEQLTRGERRYLQHLRRATARGVSVAQYCRAAGLSVQSLYNAKRELIRKGALSPPATETPKPVGTSELIQVRVAPTVSSAAPGAVCRLRHPGGWVIECASWPQATWLAQIMSGGTHVAT